MLNTTLDKSKEHIKVCVHKNVSIYKHIDTEWYAFCYNDSFKFAETLDKAIAFVDSITAFTPNDFKILMNKLDDKEKDFIRTIVNELKYHENSSRCNIHNKTKYCLDFI